MLAGTLALALALASPGAAPARPALEPPADNATRAHRGLLPRKAPRARPASRARRVVLLPPAPTWLGEPGGAPDPIVVVVAAERSATPPAWAEVAGLEVRALLVRRGAGVGEPPPLAAVVGAPEVRAVLVRRGAVAAE